MTGPELLAQLREWRRAGHLLRAQQLLAQLTRAHPADTALATLAWQHQGFWWQALVSKQIQLARRSPDDLPLVRRCWADAAFMDRFNRMAAPLPVADPDLRALLLRERWALPQESRALHWTIRDSNQACGFVSLVDISLPHRRAEFLIGTVPGTPGRVAVTAAHLVLAFAANQAKLERLVANFYPENTSALRAALHLGFTQEGVLRRHVLLPDGQRSDLVIAGLLLGPAYFGRTGRLRQRLGLDTDSGSGYL